MSFPAEYVKNNDKTNCNVLHLCVRCLYPRKALALFSAVISVLIISTVTAADPWYYFLDVQGVCLLFPRLYIMFFRAVQTFRVCGNCFESGNRSKEFSRVECYINKMTL